MLKNRLKSLSVLLFGAFLMSCGSHPIPDTKPKWPSLPDVELTSPVAMPDIEGQVEIQPKVDESESADTSIRKPPATGALVIERALNPALIALKNRQVCKDDVDVTYALPDENGYKSHYTARVQLQGRVKDVLTEPSSLKIKLWNWYTEDSTLSRWRPHLGQRPITKEAQLVSGSEFWSAPLGWYLCQFEDEQTLSI